MMITCETCGKKYQIDVEKIKAATARVKCRSCQQIITVKKPVPGPEAPAPAPEAPAPTPDPPPQSRKVPEPPVAEKRPTPAMPEEPGPMAKPAGTKIPESKGRSAKSLGLRSKMFFFFFLVPLAFIGLSALFYLFQLKELSTTITRESAGMLSTMAEEIITQNARSVAGQVAMYLAARPDLQREAFNDDPQFRKIGVQKVGLTGYSCLYSIPDQQGKSSLWVHPNEKIIGLDTPGAMKKPLGSEYDRWWKVYEGAYGGKESKGYYAWQDADGRMREKFMVCAPVEGTPFVVASTTYIDEFTMPVKTLENSTRQKFSDSRKVTFTILALTLMIIGGVVFLYGYSLTGKIRSLTEIADRISVGELDMEIDVRAKDEIGDLGEAISRMQDSIRLAVERIRKR